MTTPNPQITALVEAFTRDRARLNRGLAAVEEEIRSFGKSMAHVAIIARRALFEIVTEEELATAQ